MSHPNSKSKTSLATLFPFSMRDLIVTALILFVAVTFCILLQRLDPSAGFATPVFVLTVLLTSRLTTGYFWGLFSAVLGVIAVNFFFTFQTIVTVDPVCDSSCSGGIRNCHLNRTV